MSDLKDIEPKVFRKSENSIDLSGPGNLPTGRLLAQNTPHGNLPSKTGEPAPRLVLFALRAIGGHSHLPVL